MENKEQIATAMENKWDQMTDDDIARFAKSYGVDKVELRRVIEREKSLNEDEFNKSAPAWGWETAFALFQGGEAAIFDRSKAAFLNVSVVSMLFLNITIPLFVSRASFSDDENVLDTYQVLMGLSSLCSLGSVLVAVVWNDWLNNLCPSRSDKQYFYSLGTCGDSMLLMHLSIILGCAGFILAAAYYIDSLVAGYVALGFGTIIIGSVTYRWIITLKPTVQRTVEKYSGLNHGSLKKDWSGVVTNLLLGVDVSSKVAVGKGRIVADT